MKIKCERDKLLAAFQVAAGVAPSRSPKPILQNVKIEAADNAAVLMATDLEVGIRIDIAELEVEVPGSALLSVAQFNSILRESSDETLRIEADEHGVVVSGDRSKFKLAAGNPAEFPNVPEFEETKYHEVPARLMKELIRRTLFATDTESSRYALGGVLLEMENDRIIAVGTDGRRLAKMEGPATGVDGHATGDAMTIVPSRSMQLIERALSDGDAEIRIASRGNDFLVKSPTVTITSRLVEGRFPRWRDVLPQRPEAAHIEISVGPMHSALRQAAIVTSVDSRGIDFTFGNGSLVLCGLTADVGESHVELPIPYDGEEITLCLDHRFVSDFLKVLDQEKVFTLNILDTDSAALFETGDGYGYVVMPLARDRPQAESAESAEPAGTA
ncbi:MAG: DNA polymerase III subunit beta [Planctomycetaceae bacterium]|nr:DNA polymerase III subunit beta [Planctomycetaceae bacterium]